MEPARGGFNYLVNLHTICSFQGAFPDSENAPVCDPELLECAAVNRAIPENLGSPEGDVG